MTVELVMQVDPGVDLSAGVAALMKVTESVEIVRWIELSAAVLLFLLVPGDRESGAVYALDRTKGIWYSVDFEDEQFGGYSTTQFDSLLKDSGSSISLNGPGFGALDCPGCWLQKPRQKPPFDRKNIPGYLPTPTFENRVVKRR